MKKFNATILIVEDDRNDQFFIEQAFRNIGVTDPIQIVDDGAEAIAYMMGGKIFRPRNVRVSHIHHDRPEDAQGRWFRGA